MTGPYPADRRPNATTILTHWETLHHQNSVPVTRHQEAITMALDIAGNVDDPELLPGMLMMLLSEVPAEPLLGAKPQQIGSVLGLTSLGYLLSRQDHAETLRRMLSAGDGVVLLRITGDLDRHHANVEIFEDWEGYQRFLVPILRRGKLQKGDGSTLL